MWASDFFLKKLYSTTAKLEYRSSTLVSALEQRAADTSPPDAYRLRVEYNVDKDHRLYRLASFTNAHCLHVKKIICDAVANFYITKKPYKIKPSHYNSKRFFSLERQDIDEYIKQDRIYEFMLTVLLPLTDHIERKEFLMQSYDATRTAKDWCNMKNFPVGIHSKNSVFTCTLDEENIAFLMGCVLSRLVDPDVNIDLNMTAEERSFVSKEYCYRFDKNLAQIQSFFNTNNYLAFITETQKWSDNTEINKVSLTAEHVELLREEIQKISKKICNSAFGASGFISPFGRKVVCNVVYVIDSSTNKDTKNITFDSDIEMLMTVNTRRGLEGIQDFQVHLGIFRPPCHLVECLIMKSALLKTMFTIPRHRTFHSNISPQLHAFAALTFNSKIILSQPQEEMKNILLKLFKPLPYTFNYDKRKIKSITVHNVHDSADENELADSDLIHLATGMGVGTFIALKGSDVRAESQHQTEAH